MSAVARWLARAADDPAEALRRWQLGRRASLVAGARWDVVEVEFTLARIAITWLVDNGRHNGLFLMSGMERAVWWPLPLGTSYRLAGTAGVSVYPAGRELLAPSPARYAEDCMWIHPFRDLSRWRTLTAADDLREAVLAAGRQLDGRAGRRR